MWEFRIYQLNQGAYIVERRNQDSQWERIDVAGTTAEGGDLVADVLEGNVALSAGPATAPPIPPAAPDAGA